MEVYDKASKLVEYTQDVKNNGIGDVQAVANAIASINKETKEAGLEKDVADDIVKAVSFLVDSELKTNLTNKAATMSNKLDNFITYMNSCQSTYIVYSCKYVCFHYFLEINTLCE